MLWSDLSSSSSSTNCFNESLLISFIEYQLSTYLLHGAHEWLPLGAPFIYSLEHIHPLRSAISWLAKVRREIRIFNLFYLFFSPKRKGQQSLFKIIKLKWIECNDLNGYSRMANRIIAVKWNSFWVRKVIKWTESWGNWSTESLWSFKLNVSI